MAESGQNPPMLIVKLQYKDYEEGEFIQAKELTAAETLQLISDYPWAAQRDHLAIGLTNPSITIEGPNGDFLKLSPWYNGKFVLHYFDAGHHLFTDSFDRLADTQPAIESFFRDQPFEPTGFKKEITWLQANKVHFATGSFAYSVRFSRLILTVVLGIYLFGLWFMVTAAFSQLPRAIVWIALIPTLVIFPIWILIVRLSGNPCRQISALPAKRDPGNLSDDPAAVNFIHPAATSFIDPAASALFG